MCRRPFFALHRSELFHKVYRGIIPIFSITPLLPAVQIQLVQPEGNQDVLWLPLLPIFFITPPL